MFDPEIAEIRYGTGLSSSARAPSSVQAMLDGLNSPDRMAERFPIESFDSFAPRVRQFTQARREARKQAGTEAGKAADKTRKQIASDAREAYGTFFRNTLLRRIHTETGLRERLAFFWADHFTAYANSSIIKWATSPYIETAIRPHIGGTFEDLLISAVTHPLMLNFLDQNTSVGPNSIAAQKAKARGRVKGLNENLAREVLELHTLGVNGPYSQDDVRNLAELFAGLGYTNKGVFRFVKNNGEPGAETILGKSYGGKTPALQDIHAALRDLARHPSTAQHIAEKLARHFVSDTPDPALVTAMASAYQDTDGDLMAVYDAMLSHPSAWQAEAQNIKQPIDFMATTLRALEIDQAYLMRSKTRELRNLLYAPLQVMGQSWEKPIGPDGWPEENTHWATPQFMAARLQWALAVPQALRRTLPDPRDFARAALGNRLTPEVRFAAEAAENRWEGIALVLSSPAFQRQ